MKVLGASLTAVLILAACDQAGRAIGSVVGPRQAIAELKYAAAIGPTRARPYF